MTTAHQGVRTLDRMLVRGQDPTRAALRVICFSYAGGSAFQFRQWDRASSPSLEFVGVQLPGHDQRLGEPLLRQARAIVADVGDAVATLADKPYVLFGHSVGSLLAFEYARWTRAHGLPSPAALIVAGRPAPHVAPDYEPVHNLPDQDLLRVLRSYGGTTETVLSNIEVMKHFMPMIRADLEVNRSYLYRPEAALACPVVAIAGDRDPIAPANLVEAWGAETSGRFELVIMPGGHFFFQKDPIPLVDLIQARSLQSIGP